MSTTTRTVYAVQSTRDHCRGAGWYYRKPTTATTRRRQWVTLEEATTWPRLADAMRHRDALRVSHGGWCARVVELEMALTVKGNTHGHA